MKFNKSLSVKFIFIFGALGGLLFGFDTGIISGASPLIETDFHLDINQVGFIVSSVLIGSAIGALGVGPIADKIGRKPLLILAGILFILGALITSFASGFSSMIFGRIILGLAVGAASALTPTYLTELADTKHRGAIASMFQLLITLGILFAYCVNLIFLGKNFFGWADWRWMLGSAIIPAILLFIGALLLPESPRFLVQTGKDTTALTVLKMLRKKVANSDPQQEFNEIKNIVTSEQKGSFKDLLIHSRSQVLIAIVLMAFQQLVGINAVIYFLPQVFTKGFHFPDSTAIWVSIGIGLVNFLVTVLAFLIIDKINRKALLIFGSIDMTIALALLAIINFTTSISQAALPSVILIACYIFGFAISWGPIVWILISEIFPLAVRGLGTSIGAAANWICNFLVTQFFLGALAFFHFNIGGPFAIFAVVAFISIFYVYFFVPETRDKSLETIETELKTK